MLKKCLILPLFFFLFAACSEDPFWSREESAQSDVSVRGLSAGTVLSPGGNLSLSLDLSGMGGQVDASKTTLRIIIKDSSGHIVSNTSHQATAAGAISLPLLPEWEGTYTAEYTVDESGTQLHHSEVVFFVADNPPRLSAVNTFPVSFEPGSEGLVFLDADVPVGADPWIRWIMDGRTVQESLWSSGGAQLYWTSPMREGLYSLKVELYPFAPPGGGSFTFAAQQSLSASLLTSKNRPIEEFELGPGGDYQHLFHFQGNFRDLGSESSIASPMGTPVLAHRSGISGYLFNQGDALKFSSAQLPFQGRDPFSFALDMRAVVLQEGGQRLFSARDSRDAEWFNLHLTDDGLLGLLLQSADGPVILVSSIRVTADALLDFGVEVQADGQTLTVSWLQSGVLIKRTVRPFVPGNFEGPGSSRLAGDSELLFDEFGKRNSIHSAQLAAGEERVLFDGSSGRSALLLSANPSGVSVGRQGVDLDRGASLDVPLGALPEGRFILSLDSNLFQTDGGAEIQLREGQGRSARILFSVNSRGGIRLHAGQSRQIGSVQHGAGNVLDLNLHLGPESLVLYADDGETVLATLRLSEQPLSLRLRHLNSGDSFGIRRLAILSQKVEEKN